MRRSKWISVTLATLVSLPYAGCSTGPGGTAMKPSKPQPNAWERMTASLKSTFGGEPKRASYDPAGNAVSPNDPTSLASNSKPGVDLYVSLAAVREQTGDFDSATELYQKALAQEPTNREALLAFAHLLDRQGKLPEAEEVYRRAVAAHPRDTAALNDLALCCARQGRSADAAPLLLKAVELNPEKKLYRNNLATVLVDLGRQDEALAHLKSVHGEAAAEYNLGFLLVQKQDLTGAKAHLARAEALDPSLAGPSAQMLAAQNAAPAEHQPRVASHTAPVATERPATQPAPAEAASPQPASAAKAEGAKAESSVAPLDSEAEFVFPERLPAIDTDDYFPPSRY